MRTLIFNQHFGTLIALSISLHCFGALAKSGDISSSSSKDSKSLSVESGSQIQVNSSLLNQPVTGQGFYGGNMPRCNLGATENSSPTYRYTENPLSYGSTIQPYLNPPLVPEPIGVNIIGNDAYMSSRRMGRASRMAIPIRFVIAGDPFALYYIYSTQFDYKLEHVSGVNSSGVVIEAVHLMPDFQYSSSTIYNWSMGAQHQSIPENTAFGAYLHVLGNQGVAWFPYQNMGNFNLLAPYIACVVLKFPAPEEPGQQVIKLTPYGALQPETLGSRNEYFNIGYPPEMNVNHEDIYIRLDIQ